MLDIPTRALSVLSIVFEMSAHSFGSSSLWQVIVGTA